MSKAADSRAALSVSMLATVVGVEAVEAPTRRVQDLQSKLPPTIRSHELKPHLPRYLKVVTG